MNVHKIVVEQGPQDNMVTITHFTDSPSILYLYARGSLYFKTEMPANQYKAHLAQRYPKILVEIA